MKEQPREVLLDMSCINFNRYIKQFGLDKDYVTDLKKVGTRTCPARAISSFSPFAVDDIALIVNPAIFYFCELKVLLFRTPKKKIRLKNVCE